MPSIILHAYYYRYKIQNKTEILNAIKRRMENDGEAGDTKKKREGKKPQVYCVTKKKFYASASKDEMEGEVSFSGDLERSDVHRILQCKMRFA